MKKELFSIWTKKKTMNLNHGWSKRQKKGTKTNENRGQHLNTWCSTVVLTFLTYNSFSFSSFLLFENLLFSSVSPVFFFNFLFRREYSTYHGWIYIKVKRFSFVSLLFLFIYLFHEQKSILLTKRETLTFEKWFLFIFIFVFLFEILLKMIHLDDYYIIWTFPVS